MTTINYSKIRKVKVMTIGGAELTVCKTRDEAMEWFIQHPEYTINSETVSLVNLLIFVNDKYR